VAEVAFGVVDDRSTRSMDEYAADIRKHFIPPSRHRSGHIQFAPDYDSGRADEKRRRAPTSRRRREAPAPQRAMKSTLERDALKDGRSGRQGKEAATTAHRDPLELRRHHGLAQRDHRRPGPGDRRGRHPDTDDLEGHGRAVTADSRFGQETGSVVSRKEMIVRLETPRFFTQNDATVISAIAHNYLEATRM